MVLSTDRIWDQVLYIAIVLLIALVVGRTLRFLIGRFVKTASTKLKVDPTKYNFLKNTVEFVTYIIATIIIFNSIPALHSYGTALFAGAGVFAAIVGFASQSAFSNIVSGVFIVIFRPFSVGDRIRVGTLYTGDVLDITLRHTVIRDFENRRIVIPNAIINNETILNSTLDEEKICVFIELTLAMDAPVQRALEIVREVIQQHPEFRDNRTDAEKATQLHPVEARVLEITEAGIRIRGWAWVDGPSVGFVLKCDVLETLKMRFDAEGIALAVPNRIITVKGKTDL